MVRGGDMTSQRRILVAVFFVVLCPCFAFGVHEVGAGEFTYSGHIRNETAVRIDDLDEFMKIESTFQLKAEYRLNDRISFFGMVREFYDSVFDAEARFRDNRKKLSRTRGTDWLRELYVDLYLPNVDLRLGKQQIVWGTADGLKILDILNPTDQREFFLDNFADSRQPLWMAKIEYAPTVNGLLQVLIIPDFESHFLSPPDSPFTYGAVQIQGDTFDQLRAMGLGVSAGRDKPGQSFKNSKFGIRWLDVIGGFEYTLNYLHGYDLYPAPYFLGARFDPGRLLSSPLALPITLDFEDRFERTELLGASFSWAITSGSFRGLTIRGEFAYIKNDPTPFEQAGGPPGIRDIDDFNYVIGFDKYFWTDWFFSVQFIQFIILPGDNHGKDFLGPAGGPLDQVETLLSLKVSTDFFHERVKPDILILYGDDNDWRISPRMEIEVTEDIIVTPGFHLFYGSRDQLFGEFRNNDQVFLEVKFGF
jgi:hypothetical protein